MHIAYTVSADNRWITAVWSDDWGQVAFQESFFYKHLYLPSNGPTQPGPFERAAPMIWRRTIEILRQPKINWKLIVARIGPMVKQEYMIWRMLKEEQEKSYPGKITLVLTSVELNPPVEISVVNSGYTDTTSPMAISTTPFPSSTAAYSQSPPAGVNSYGTPVATPLAQTNESPDPSGGLLSTPGGTVNPDSGAEFDPDVRWMDSRDEIWAVVLNHRIPISTNVDPEKGILFSVASGFLWPVKSHSSNLIQVRFVTCGLI